ncbi:MAG: DUF3421 domain-containing protein [Coxiellaceae bacterium]|nr:DUF3421 domain-containing protein [Coxiellaceae bacterium]
MKNRVAIVCLCLLISSASAYQIPQHIAVQKIPRIGFSPTPQQSSITELADVAIKQQQQVIKLQQSLDKLDKGEKQPSIDYIHLSQQLNKMQSLAATSQGRVAAAIWQQVSSAQTQVVALQTAKKYQWVNTQLGKSVSNSVIAGYDQNGAVYACRTEYQNNSYPGQLIKQGCRITKGTDVIVNKQYKLLVSTVPIRWQVMGSILPSYRPPAIAVIGGEQQGNNVYICRDLYKNAIHVGKVVSRGCQIVSDGKVINLQLIPGAHPYIMVVGSVR